jgi:hypothetical protein
MTAASMKQGSPWRGRGSNGKKAGEVLLKKNLSRTHLRKLYYYLPDAALTKPYTKRRLFCKRLFKSPLPVL